MQEKLKLESIKNINKNIKLVPLLSRGGEAGMCWGGGVLARHAQLQTIASEANNNAFSFGLSGFPAFSDFYDLRN